MSAGVTIDQICHFVMTNYRMEGTHTFILELDSISDVIFSGAGRRWTARLGKFKLI